VMDHPARARVAEIMVSRVGKEDTRGSGYLVSPGWVLTAHHVVKDAASVGVWLGAPRELVPRAGVAVDPGQVLAVPAADLALLPLGRPAADLLCEPALFGRLDRDPGPAVPAAAAGCPRFKLRPAPDRPAVLLRDLHYAIGSIDPLSDAKTDRFAFAVDASPGPDPEPDKHSPWEGMSGAAVWASSRLIGVVSQHHPQEGLATLTVCPVEQLFSYASEDQLEAFHAALPQLPATAGNLWLSTPPTVRKIEVERARRAAQDLAPRVLIGRDAELAALREFAGSDLQWRWLQGDAFAGKTALLAWFTLHPPEGVDVVGCFLRRTTGDNGADYALDVLIRQLALLAGRGSLLPPLSLSERAHDFVDLLDEATRASHERGNRLLVVIDGLDEYDPTAASLELAAWLPGARTLPEQAKLLVARRAGAGIDLPQGHPLAGNLQRVTASETATEIQGAARRELERALKATGGFASRVHHRPR
jgi:trypsin-like peptidase